MGVRYKALTYTFDGDSREYGNYDIPYSDFYKRMEDGGIARTAAINIDGFMTAFREILDEGKDVFYLAFSSGLSSTYSSGCAAAEELAEEYPDSKIIVVDSLAASSGYGLLLYLATRQKEAGATIEEVAQYCIDNRLHLCHWFTVLDLKYLKRGGRVSAAAAAVGTMLSIKPVLHVDNEGHLINMYKARGRKASLQAIANEYGKRAIDPAGGTVFISHGECYDDARTLADMIEQQYGVKTELITYVGAVIGAHAGPGVLALFFLGNER